MTLHQRNQVAKSGVMARFIEQLTNVTEKQRCRAGAGPERILLCSDHFEVWRGGMSQGTSYLSYFNIVERKARKSYQPPQTWLSMSHAMPLQNVLAKVEHFSGLFCMCRPAMAVFHFSFCHCCYQFAAHPL